MPASKKDVYKYAELHQRVGKPGSECYILYYGNGVAPERDYQWAIYYGSEKKMDTTSRKCMMARVYPRGPIINVNHPDPKVCSAVWQDNNHLRMYNPLGWKLAHWDELTKEEQGKAARGQ